MGYPWRVLQLADSGFPTGGFAHSGGLEAAVQQGEVRGLEGLERFVRELLWQAGNGALPLLSEAWREPGSLEMLDARTEAFLTNHVANRASRTQGRTLVATASRIFPEEELQRLHAAIRARALLAHHAPMFGFTLRALAVPLAQAQELFLHLALRGHGPDDNRALLILNSTQLVQVLQIDQMRRLGQPQLHHWDQAVSAGEDPSLLAVLCQKRDRLVH